MMKNTKIPYLLGWLCCGMTLFSACGQSEVEELENENLRMSVIASIEHLDKAPQGRYAGVGESNDPDDVRFVKDDKIGVFKSETETASEWTFDGTKWNSTGIVYWPSVDKEHTFYAFYPYQAAASINAVPMPSLLEQNGDLNSLSQCDFLVATTTGKYTPGGVVDFTGEGKTFKHVSSLIALTIVGTTGDLQNATLKRISIKGTNLVAPSSYSFKDKTVTPMSGENTDLLEVPLDHEMGSSDVTYFFIVNAYEKTDDNSEIELMIQYTTSMGLNFEAKLKGFSGNTLKGGVRQNYTITISDAILTVSGAFISKWGEGKTFNVPMNGTTVPNE